MQTIDGFSPLTFQNHTPVDDPFVVKLAEIISKIGMKSLKEEEIEEEKTTLTQFLNVLPYHLCPQERLPDFIRHTKELSLSQFPKEEHVYLEESEVNSLEELSKDLSLSDIKIKIIQALAASTIPDLALDLWLGEISENFATGNEFSLSFLDTGVDLFFASISKNQLNDALVLLSYLSSTKEMTFTEVIASFSLLCQEILKQNDPQLVILEENQELFESIAQNLADKNLTPEHTELRKLIDFLLLMGKQPVVDLILNSHLKKLNYSFKNFEKFQLKKPVLLKQFFSASLELKDPSLAIDLFVALLNHSKHPLEESEFFLYYEKILPKLIINESSIFAIEKILKHRISLSRDLDASLELPFINAILKQIDSSNQTLYFSCWELLCKVLNEEPRVTEDFYKTFYLLFNKRILFKKEGKNPVTQSLKEKYQSFLNNIREMSVEKLQLLQNLTKEAEKTQFFSESELSSWNLKILKKFYDFQKAHGNLEVLLKVVTNDQKISLFTSKKQIEEEFSYYLDQAWTRFQNDKNGELLEKNLNLMCQFLGNSIEQMDEAIAIINEFHLKNTKNNDVLFSYLIKKIYAIIDNPQFDNKQKLASFHSFIYGSIDQADKTTLLLNALSKLSNKINLAAERCWEFKILIYPKKVKINEKDLTSARQGLFLAMKHLLTNDKISINTFKTALRLFEQLTLFDKNPHNSHKIYHIFFKAFRKFISTAERNQINLDEKDLENLVNIYDKLSISLNQTIENQKKNYNHNSEIGSLLISKFAGLLLLGEKHKIFINHESKVFELLHHTLNLSKNWVEYTKKDIEFQLTHGEIFEEILHYFEDKKLENPPSDFIAELKKQVQFFKNDNFQNVKKSIIEIFHKFNPFRNLSDSTIDSTLTQEIENQLYSGFKSLSSIKDKGKKFDEELSKVLNLFKKNNINSIQHIHNLFKFVAITQNKELKSEAWNFFNSIEIACTDHIDAFYYANTWKILFNHNIIPQSFDALCKLKKIFPLLDNCFIASNQIPEKISLYKDLLSWCQETFESHSKKTISKKESAVYFTLLTQCAFRLYELNVPINVDRNVAKGIFNLFIAHYLQNVESLENLVNVFIFISLAKIMGIHEDIYIIFGQRNLQQYLWTYIESEIKKTHQLSDHKKADKLKEITSLAASLNKIIFLSEDSYVNLLVDIFEIVLNFLSTITDHPLYLSVFEWAKQEAINDYKLIKNLLEKELINKVKQIYQTVTNQTSFNKKIQFALINLSILFDLNYPINAKKKILKLFCDDFLKKYSVVSEHEKNQLLNLCMQLKPTCSRDPEFYEILFTIISLPTQRKSLLQFKCDDLNIQDHKDTIEKLFNHFMLKNTQDDFVRCLNIAAFLLPFDPNFSKCLYASLFEKYRNQISSSPQQFADIINSLAQIDRKDLLNHKNKILADLVPIFVTSSNINTIQKILKIINKSYSSYQDKTFTLCFIYYIVEAFHKHLKEEEFTKINQRIKVFFENCHPKSDLEKFYYLHIWINWLKYTHFQFTKIFKQTPMQALGGIEIFESIFPNTEQLKVEAQNIENLDLKDYHNEKYKIEALYYCNNLKEFSKESVEILIEKIESTHPDSLPDLIYLSRDVLDYLIQNQIDQAIRLFNSLLKNEHFELFDRIAYAYYIYEQLDQLSLNPDAKIDFANFFNGIKNTDLLNIEFFFRLLILLEKQGKIEIKNQLTEFFNIYSWEPERLFYFLSNMAHYQQKAGLNDKLIETVHEMVLSLVKGKEIQTTLWIKIFKLINFLKDKNLNEKVINTFLSLSQENEMSRKLWLTTFKTLENLPESLFHDEEKMAFFFEIFKPDQSLHLEFCQHFIKKAIRTVDLLDEKFNKVEKLTQMKSQILEKFGHLEKEITPLIFELEFKIFMEKISDNPSDFSSEFLTFLQNHFSILVSSQPKNVIGPIHMIFKKLTSFPALKESSNESFSEKLKEFVICELNSLEDHTTKFTALLALTNKGFETQLLSQEDRQNICDKINSYLYEWLTKNIDTSPDDNQVIDTWFKMGSTYTSYFYPSREMSIDVIKRLTSYSLKELEIINKGKIFESRMQNILNMVMKDQWAFCIPFLDMMIEFYYQTFSNKIIWWIREFINYAKTNIKSLNILAPSKYLTLCLLANIPIDHSSQDEILRIQKTLPSLLNKLAPLGFQGISKAIKVFDNYKHYLPNETLIKCQSELTKQLKENVTTLSINDHKRSINKSLKQHINCLSEIAAQRKFSSANILEKILEDTIDTFNKIACKKFYSNEESYKLHKLIYDLINLNIAFEERYNSLNSKIFEKLIELLTEHPEYYPTKQSEKAIFARALMKLFKHKQSALSRLKNNNKEKAIFKNVLSKLNKEPFKDIFSSNAYTKDGYEYLCKKFSISTTKKN